VRFVGGAGGGRWLIGVHGGGGREGCLGCFLGAEGGKGCRWGGGAGGGGVGGGGLLGAVVGGGGGGGGVGGGGGGGWGGGWVGLCGVLWGGGGVCGWQFCFPPSEACPVALTRNIYVCGRVFQMIVLGSAFCLTRS